MNYFKIYHAEKIPERLIRLRKEYNLKQKDIGNPSIVSKIELGKKDITDSVLYDFKSRTNISYSYLIFGELDEFINDLFFKFFSQILKRDLNSVEQYDYKFTYISYNKAKVIQNDCLKVAKTFAHFNFQRTNFLKSDDLFMDTFSKSGDINLIIDDYSFNPSRSFRENVINKNTVVDFIGMFEIIYSMIKTKLSHSFQNYVCNNLFNLDENDYPTNIKLSSIDSLIFDWWQNNVSKEIIPNLIDKLKSSPLFNLGYIVDDMLNNIYRDDIPTSYLSTVPVKITSAPKYVFSKKHRNQYTGLQEQLCQKIENDLLRIMKNGKNPMEIYEKYPPSLIKILGYNIEEFPAKNETIKVSFQEIIELVSDPLAAPKIPDDSSFELHEIKLSVEGKQRVEQALSENMNELQIEDLIRTHSIYLGDNSISKSIEGLLTNNSQVTYYFQEHLNTEIYSIAKQLSSIQQSFLSLLTKEELQKFAL